MGFPGDSDGKASRCNADWVQSLSQKDALEKGMATSTVFLPGEFHGQRTLVGYSPWSLKGSDTTGQLTLFINIY